MQFPASLLRQCWFLAGPTASGKSAVALDLAGMLDAEILALDSMTIYRGMDIGTDKPGPRERQQVPHHLLDLLEPHEEFSLQDYLEAAETAVREVLVRGRTPLFVGGAGMYLRGLLRGVFAGPAADWPLREQLAEEARRTGLAELHQRLQRVDPAAAARIHPNDERRIVRALEVWQLTGRPVSEQHQETALPPEQRPPHVYWLSPPRGWLYARIDSRVREMLRAGLVAEVQNLIIREQPLSRTARQGLGYKEVIDGLENGSSEAEIIERVQTRTRQFAKRQHTWFRNLEECQAIEITGRETPRQLAEQLFQRHDI